MPAELISILLIIMSYLMGSVPTAYIIGKLVYKVDIREMGSGNVGGANSARLFGKKVGVIVGFTDIFKGTLAVFVTMVYNQASAVEVGFFARSSNIIALAAFAAVFGHCYSIFLKFSGGKGGATTAGVILAINPLTFLVLISFWIVIVGTTRFTSLGNLLAVFIIPLMFNITLDSSVYTFLGYGIVALIYFKHLENIGRLLAGEERKFGEKETTS